MFCTESDGEDDPESPTKKPDTVNFVVMLKKNNKPQVWIRIFDELK